MIAYVDGFVEDITEDNTVIDVGGIGYNVNISSVTASKMPGIGEHVRLYTYTCVREDAFILFGFLNKDELDIFKKCITVNGIGPKGALAILSTLDAESFRFAVLSGDVKAISKAPGIGSKTAQKLILDLKDKLKYDDSYFEQEIRQTESGNELSANDQIKEAVQALISLGYGQTESLKAVKSIENVDELDAGAILKSALKKMF
jgi:Holliday junction DNA helicase RuvA